MLGITMVRKNDYLTKVDQYVGAKIYNLRLAQGYSRKQLSELINVSNQQLHKYEIGINRICLGRLMMIAKALSEDVKYFYEGIGDYINPKSSKVSEAKYKHQRLCIEISRNFMKIQKETYRRAIKLLIKAMAEA